MSYQGEFKGANIRSEIVYAPTNKASAFLDRVWLTGSIRLNGDMVINLELLMKDESRKSFSTSGDKSLDELFQEADQWVEKNLPI
jgi:hypothetical protein